MKVVLDNGAVVDLGITEAAPTIGITDYSRRVTDDYGVTTIVQRGFARRMSVRLGVAFDQTDALQRMLADLRAKPAMWIADDRFDSLAFRGFYKDFSLDLAIPPLSLCTLTIEGLVATEDFVDAGNDPAPDGVGSTLQLLRPFAIGTAQLLASNVAEMDAPEWQPAMTYALGARVIMVDAHRIYESAADANLGNDPKGTSGKWIDIGPTNRWAMFDQALGTVTHQAGGIAVTIGAGAIDAIALLDVAGDTVRVQAPGYDRTASVGDGAVTFLDLPGIDGQIIVSINGAGDVAIGTLLAGSLVSLGVTEASPTAGITDYSRKNVDEFGEVSIVERSWAKRMTTNALIRTADVDQVAGRIAAVRALPSLWIGQEGRDSLTVYGFFKDFSIEVGESVSKLSLSIEGLSSAAPVVPFAPGGSVAWPDVTDPTGTKPTDNADVTGDNTSKDTNAVGGKPATDLLKSLDDLEKVTIPAVSAAVAQADARITAAAGEAAAAVAEANAQIAAAQLTLDGAVTDLAAEIARAQGKDEELVQRIDSLIVDGGGYNDTNVRALIERAETARADGDRALANRIDTVVTSYQDLDTATNARITQQVTALSNASEALATRSTALEARSSFEGFLNRNATFGDYPTTDGIPSAWTDGGNGSSGRRVTGLDSPNGYRQDTVSTADFAIVQIIPAMTKGWYVVEIAVRKVAGDLVASEVLVECLDRFGSVVEQHSISLFATKDITGQAPSGGVDGRVYRYSPMIEIASTATASINLWAFSGRTARAAASVYLEWYRVGLRVAADAEVMAQVAAESLIPSLTARVTSTETALTDATSAIAQRIDEVVTGYSDLNTATNTRITSAVTALSDADTAIGQSVQGISAAIATTDTNLRALVETKEAAAVGRETAISQRVDTLIAEGGGGSDGVDTVARSEISRVEQASVIRDTALASRSTTLEARGAFDGYINRNASFGDYPLATGLPASWADGGNGPAGYRAAGVQSPYSYRQDTLSGGRYAIVQVVPSTGPGWYVAAFTVRKVAGSLAASMVMIEALDAYGSVVEQHRFELAATADVNENVPGPGTDGQIYRYSPQFKIASPAATSVNVWAFSGLPELASASAYLEWHLVGLRVAAAGEIAGGKANAALPVLTARIKSTEDVITDLPNRYAGASRTTTLEAQLAYQLPSGLSNAIGAVDGRVTDTSNTLVARIEDRATAIADAKAGAVAQTLSQLRAEYNGTAASVTQQAGAIVNLQGKASAYVRLVADGGNGRAALSLWSDQYGGSWTLTGDGQIDGNLTVNGTITARKFDRLSVSREGTATWSGSITPGTGQTLTVPWSLALTQIPALGRFIYEYTVAVSSNAGQRVTSTLNGRPYYIDYIDDGGLTIVAVDGQGNRYIPKPNSSQAVLATTDFVPSWAATIFNGNSDTGVVNQGDYYIQKVSATYTVTAINLKVTWVAI